MVSIVSEDPNTPAAAAPAAPPAATPAASAERMPSWAGPLAIALLLISLGALALAWQGYSRQQSLEELLVRRQEANQADAANAKANAKAAQDLARDTAAKVALLDARLAEVALQRAQLEELMQSMSRSRDENIVNDIEAAVRVALQQTVVTGSAEPLVAALKQADERLQRYKQPRLEGIRRAVARDLDRVKAVSVVDVSSLTVKLDEAARLFDELPLLNDARANPRREAASAAAPKAGASAAAAQRPEPPAEEGRWAHWMWQLGRRWDAASTSIWGETRELVRVTRIERPEAALITPEQSFFLRENLKLRLLNARLALLSRQFDTAQSDLRDSQEMLNRYFDTRSRKVASVTELLRQVAGQARQVSVPRPDDTLAALTAAAAGR